jgi:hypothetical protein
MATQVKKKHIPKGVRLGWTPLKDVQPVKLTPELVKGERVAADRPGEQNSSNTKNSYLIP